MTCELTHNCEETIYQLKRIGSAASLGEVADIFTLKEDITLIGRAKCKVDFYMDSLKNKGLISRIHARIFKSKTSSGRCVFKICDTSLNGTFVNDIKIKNEVSLVLGDTIAFGHLQGAALDAGKSYSQPDSEFRFKFKQIFGASTPRHSNGLNRNNNIESSENGMTNYSSSIDETPKYTPNGSHLSDFPETPTSPEYLPVSLETPTLSSSLKNDKLCPTKRELVKNFNDSENDFDILQEYAMAASLAAGMQNDSDDDLFSVKYASLLPGGAVCKEDNSTKSTEKTKRKRKRTWKVHEESSSLKKCDKPRNDGCQAKKCLKPTEKLVSWVQCDDCDEWYHVKCAGLSLKLVKPKNAKFHCGCI